MKSKASARDSITSPHVQGVNATSSGLVKATVGAAVVAGAILTFLWLPAEYGIDPTGAGHMLGLTEMGQIKEQLQADAAADVAVATKGVQTGLSDSELSEKLDAIQNQLIAIAATIGATSDAASTQIIAPTVALTDSSAAESATSWRDEEDFTVQPGFGIEVKLVMDEGAVAEYEWSANGAVLDHDTHGDGNDQTISYEKGRSVPEQAGQLTAAFTGNHGWYWKNQTDAPVVVTIRTRGDYEEML